MVNYKNKNKNKKPKRKYKRRVRKKNFFKKNVKKIIKDTLAQEVEKKYILDTSFTSHLSDYNTSNRAYLIDISPTIPQSTDKSSRIGNEVRITSLHIFMRMAPPKQFYSLDVGGVDSNGDPITPSYNNQIPPNLPNQELLIIRYPATLALSDDNFLKSVRAKYRPFGSWRQDYITDGDLTENFSSLDCIYKKKFRLSYSNSYGVGLDNNSQMSMFVNCCPNLKYLPINIYKKVNKKMQIDETTSQLQDWKYKIIIFLDDKFNNDNWIPIDQYDQLASRQLWTFTDM